MISLENAAGSKPTIVAANSQSNQTEPKILSIGAASRPEDKTSEGERSVLWVPECSFGGEKDVVEAKYLLPLRLRHPNKSVREKLSLSEYSDHIALLTCYRPVCFLSLIDLDQKGRIAGIRKFDEIDRSYIGSEVISRARYGSKNSGGFVSATRSEVIIQEDGFMNHGFGVAECPK